MPNPGQSRASYPVLWVAGVVILIVAIFFGARSLGRSTVEVRVTPVTYQTLEKTVQTNGKVEPVHEYQAHAPFPGVIKKIYVSVGQHVTKQQLLVQMDDSAALARLAAAKLQLSGAEIFVRDLQSGGSLEDRNRFATDLASAKLDQQDAATRLATTQKLFEKGAASAAEVESAQQRLRVTDLASKSAQTRASSRYNAGDLANAQARVADANASLLAAQNAYADVDMRAPQDGTVYSVPVSEYDFVPAGDDILDIADLNHVIIRAYFDEPDIGRLARGQAVQVAWDAKPGVIWHGHIDQVPTTVITYGTRNVGECIIAVDDARGDLLPNTNVLVTVTETRRTHVLSVPREALHTDGANNFVYRIVKQKLVRTPVQVDVVNNTNVQITGGLADNDVVVLGPRSTSVELSNGLQVKAVQ